MDQERAKFYTQMAQHFGPSLMKLDPAFEEAVEEMSNEERTLLADAMLAAARSLLWTIQESTD